MIRDYMTMAQSNLAHRKTRSWLTLIGIFIGIAAVVALISLGQGLQVSLTSEFLQLGADKLQITPKTLGVQVSESENDLRERDLRVVEQTNGVLHAIGFNMKSAKVTWSKDTVGYYSIIGTSDDPILRKVVEDYFTLKLDEGRRLKQGDATKAMVGYDLTNPDKLDEPMKVGDKIVVNDVRFEVVGTFKKMGDPVADSAVYITDKGYTQVYGTKDQFSSIIVQAQPGADVDLLAADLKQGLRRSRNLKEGDENFEVQTPQDLVDSFAAVFDIVRVVIYGIAAISLLVGGIGIMNTMYTAVLERTKEIGIMKAIGATNRTVLLIFLFESGLLGLLGGAIGVIFGMTLAKLTEYIGKTVLDTTLLYAWWSWWLIIGALAFAFFTGVCSGLLPAWDASKKKPVDSLRYQ